MNTTSYPRIVRGAKTKIPLTTTQLNIDNEVLNQPNKLHITFSQMDELHPNGAVICKLGVNNEISVDVDNALISCELTEYETRRFNSNIPVKVQLIQIDDDGIICDSDILKIRVKEILCPGHEGA